MTDKQVRLDPHRSRRLYDKILKLAPELLGVRDRVVSKALGYMDLNLDVLEKANEYLRIELSHYWEHPSGILIADPSMEIGVYINDRLAEALIYQDTLLYEAAYSEGEGLPDLTVHTRLNVFLEQWLDNLFEQGHRFSRGE